MSGYTEEEKAQSKKEWGEALKRKLLYSKKKNPKKPKRKRGLKKGEWKGRK